MERPKAESRPLRVVTGEIIYLDEMRRLNQQVDMSYDELSDTARENYEMRADKCREKGIEPAIMKEYEQYDNLLSDAEKDVVALADALLAYKDTPLSFEDFTVDEPPEAVLDQLTKTRAGRELLTSPEEQLAIESDGSYYPVLDVKKRDLTLRGVSVRAWGWDYQRVVFTNTEGEPYDYPADCLWFPDDEKDAVRKLDITFAYTSQTGSRVAETVSIYTSGSGTSLHRDIWMLEYAETGYEGHHGKQLDDVSEADILEFINLVAKIVGDDPETRRMKIDREYQMLHDDLSQYTGVSGALDRMLELTWTGQLAYELELSREEYGGDSIASRLRNDKTRQEALVRLERTVAR